MEDSRPTSCIRDYLRVILSLPLPLCPCIDSDPQNEDVSDYGSVANHGFSKPFFVLDVIWNLGFVLVSIVGLLFTMREKPSNPLRVWIGGYAMQCLLHVGCVYYDYQWRINGQGYIPSSTLKKLESANTIASSFWWVFGFYCVVTGGRSLLQDAPYLYWLAVVFLALDVFFMIFCIGIAFVICLALFCCIPILAIAYTMTIREGASEDEIKLLPKYRLHQSCALRLPASTESSDWHSADKLALQLEDSECCICLTQYVEGAELCSLPCNHYFHFGCISRWLRINATCPLCKFNIKAKGDTLV